MRRPVYVAGPYAGDIARNVARARAVGRLAVERGYTPVVPHLLGAGGLYGDPTEGDAGVRERAIECGVELAAAVAQANGCLWGIALDGGSLSEGSAAEVHAWARVALPLQRDAARILVWSAWASLCRDAGIGLEGT